MTTSEIEQRFERLLLEIRSYLPGVNANALKRAFEQAMLWRAHGRDGDNDPGHVIEIVEVLARLRLDETSLIAGFLHEIPDHVPDAKEKIRTEFGEESATLLEGVARLLKLNFRSRKEQQVQSFRKMLLTLASDLRVILITLAHRHWVMNRLDRIPEEEKRLEISQETLDIYAPLAGRLGIQWLKVELENLSFRVLNPEDFEQVRVYVEKELSKRQSYVETTVQRIRGLMDEQAIPATVYGRAKHPYSIFRKIRKKQIDIQELYDLIAFRVIVDDIEQCYRALGLIHAHWRPIHGQFEDYIAMPKPNGYRSLHTNVLGAFGERMEVQIRTREMHEVAENGIAAHWRYKEGGGKGAYDPIEHAQVNWVRQVLQMQQEMSDSGEFLDAVKLDMFTEDVFAFTPTGDVVELPKGATALDFAYAVHTKVGFQCSGAKVNGRMVPLKHELANGDQVEILTNKNQRPKKEWLAIAKTSRARNKIRHAIREEEREKSRELGRQVVEREFKAAGLNLNRMVKENSLAAVLDRYRVRSFDELLINIGRGQLKTSAVLELVLPKKPTVPEKTAPPLTTPQAAVKASPAARKRRAKSGIIISDLDDMLVRMARCCNPIVGDAIVGFVTRGRGVSIHRADCPKLPRQEPERILDASWDQHMLDQLRVRLKVVSRDRTGLLNQITTVFASHKANIVSANISTSGQTATDVFLLEIKDLEQLERIRRDLKRLKGVMNVERVWDAKLP